MALAVTKDQAAKNAQGQQRENQNLGREINNGYNGDGPVKSANKGDGPAGSNTSVTPTTQSTLVGTSANPNTYPMGLNMASQQQAQPTASSTGNDYINQQYQQALQAKAAALQKARDTAINGYNAQIDALPSQYQPLRNQASLTGAQNSRAINETMAAQGNWRSGANQTAQTANNASTANNIASYNQAQQQAVDKLKQAIAQANTDYESGMAGATADNEAQRLAALLNQANADRGYNLQEAGLTGNLNGQSTLAAQQLAEQRSQDQFNNGINTAQMTGYYNGQPTMAQKTMDQNNSQWQQTFNHSINQDAFNNSVTTSQLTGTYNNQPTMAQKTLDQSISQDNFNNGINAAQVTGYIPNSISSLYPAYNIPSQTYGLAADVAANPGINLYIPGQTQLKAGDIFLGGTGTGVTDAMLNGATRIAGNTANDTSALYKTYLNNVAAGRTPTTTQPQASALPSFVAQQYPGATDVVNTGNGMYKFKDSSGNLIYYNAGVGN